MSYIQIKSIDQFYQIVESKREYYEYAFHNIDFTKVNEVFLKCRFIDCLFMGCQMDTECWNHIEEKNINFPLLNVPFNVYPSRLYTKDTIYNNYSLGDPTSYKKTLDSIVYDHYLKNGKQAHSIHESLARRLHDHSMTDAIKKFLSNYEVKQNVAIMGGHGISRIDPDYKKTAILSKRLTERGYLMLSGGGPGAMEATHLGAHFAEQSEDLIDDALTILAEAPYHNDEHWLDAAMRVISKFPRQTEKESLGIPTWLYGQEPATPFASKIAKYFANSVREEGLLAVAKGGIIYTPGSAGTLQEVFQDACQNHYLSYGTASPMIFMGKKFWTETSPIYSLLKNLEEKGSYNNLLLSIYDSIDDIIEELEAFK
jgi:predicted Rossmann-fold nucleotide-binding protein